ncbi:cation diffusion facilitator family transporter [Deinococcus maricopensis]|uniref:Cation diffusion facilitator family transporter n=1 Tax=Deinococcus maricopensis (strain DSM 21211 / LMG 22137 / NRRL B-23946 / LB-34) TaxID=709986 RepID=E8U342_DEIML|nr:cation diffusion facilitator family transporter [Deinococcus maricopensis]ADV65987.1 cation diffusion facilitator family transporter [Deinococcus maricopensis DSM 21211]
MLLTPTRLALGSVLIGLLVLALKFVAYQLTGSVALYSDALESIINVVASIAALIALRISARPADANHPYGHTKAEYFSAVLEGTLILLAAFAILREAVLGFMHPRAFDANSTGLLISGGASVLNGVWATLLLRFGQRWRSAALTADGRHLITDVVTSVGVLVGVGLAALTGWRVLDPLLAAVVAVNVLWSGWQLVRESVGGLMDAAPAPEVVAQIRDIIARTAVGALEAHDVRARHAGHATFIEFHLVVPGDMRVAEAHGICDRLEETLQAQIEGAVVTIHVEPEGQAKHTGVLVL